MAIQLHIHFAKKLPIPGADFSSQQASVTVRAEVSEITDVLTESAKLYRLCEQAVDQQLMGEASAPLVPHEHYRSEPSGNESAMAGRSPGLADRRYPGSGAQRVVGASSHHSALRTSPSRGRIRPVTSNQLSLLDRLLQQSPHRGAPALARYGVAEVGHLTVQQASKLIDELKQLEVRG